ncbi:amphi-Trp domain-containing protein [Desulfovibrio sp. JC010]|uniref:amphi-Trp domain-containing protein n=1 Tax=Desulfovibrio sp. JC010 TaxID=2593641 RepID=UPI0013D8B8DE|nr:amphi-Trp domain-containing protein [Desulfovibrio sp. JC010]NDV28609.1 amphi-Trp domain-containing protein [Desulfovibrio sp. JC010]
MGKEGKAKVSLKKTVGQEEAIAILEDILKSFKAGNMVIQNGEESVTLLPSDEINMEIKAKTKKLKNKLSMKLSWKAAPVEAESANQKTEPENQAPESDSGKARVVKKADK